MGSDRILSSEMVTINSKNQKIDDKEVLNFPIESEGTNLSTGQRQLVCIARALI